MIKECETCGLEHGPLAPDRVERAARALWDWDEAADARVIEDVIGRPSPPVTEAEREADWETVREEYEERARAALTAADLVRPVAGFCGPPESSEDGAGNDVSEAHARYETGPA